MGGLGSGNVRSDKKIPVEQCLRLDMRQFVLLRVLQASMRAQGTLYWPANAARQHDAPLQWTLNTATHEPWMSLHYTVLYLETDITEEIQYGVRLATTQPHFGGHKWWFVCPACGQRMTQLYLPLQKTYFACKHCHQLSYRTRQDRWAPSTCEWPALFVERIDVSEARVLRAGRRVVEGRQRNSAKG